MEKKIEKLARLATRVERLIEEQNHEAALSLVDDLKAQAAKLGVASAYVHWLRAVLLDTAPPPARRHDEALLEIQSAVALDPISVPFRNSRRAILHNLKALMADPARPADDPEIPRLWALLVGVGEADSTTHLALARHRVAVGDLDEALRLVTAINTLSPDCVDAWQLRLVVAAKLAGPEALAIARAEAAAAGAIQVPFITPVVAEG